MIFHFRFLPVGFCITFSLSDRPECMHCCYDMLRMICSRLWMIVMMLLMMVYLFDLGILKAYRPACHPHAIHSPFQFNSVFFSIVFPLFSFFLLLSFSSSSSLEYFFARKEFDSLIASIQQISNDETNEFCLKVYFLLIFDFEISSRCPSSFDSLPLNRFCLRNFMLA